MLSIKQNLLVFNIVSMYLVYN